MINEKDIVNLKSILDSRGIRTLLNLEGKYYNAFVDLMCWTYRNTDAIVWVNSRYQRISNFLIKAIIVLGGALVSTFKFRLKYNKYCFRNVTNKNVAIPFCGAHIRYKYIYDFTNNDVSLVYPPLFHYQFINKHINCFEEQGHSITFGCFYLKDIAVVGWKIIRHYRMLKKCHYAVDNYFEKHYGEFISVIITSLLYQKFIRNVIKSISDKETPHNWLLDYDFDYKYIMINNEIKRNRNNDVTFHVQHGAFFGYDDAYCNPISDVSLCCCEREKRIIESANKFGSNIYAIGSSWQSIERVEALNNSNQIKYDILVLLTDAVDNQMIADAQKKILHYLSKLDVRIMVRYRPQSAHYDRQVLQSYTRGMIVSDGTTLQQDIVSTKVIVCFSEDAIFECFRNNKKVLFVARDITSYSFEKGDSNNVNIVSALSPNIDKVKKFLDNPICDYSNDLFVKYNFGEFEFDRIKTNLNRIIDQI